MKNAIAWFEIPVRDIERAKRFYETVFGARFQVLEVGRRMALFPVDFTQGVGGALVQGPGYEPARPIADHPAVTEGVKVYLDAGDDLAPILARVEAAGGGVLVPKTQVSPEFGWMGAFMDTEGNWVGLHSRG
jgi:uncharacterized protein